MDDKYGKMDDIYIETSKFVLKLFSKYDKNVVLNVMYANIGAEFAKLSTSPYSSDDQYVMICNLCGSKSEWGYISKDFEGGHLLKCPHCGKSG